MLYISGLVWETERPVHGTVRKSPTFCLLGYEWNFTLELFNNADNVVSYKITLSKLSDNRPLNKKVAAAVYVRSDGTSKGSCLYEITGRVSAKQIVWSRVANSADTVLGSEMHHGKWKVTIIFACDHHLNLQYSENETELASSRDKCVQACYDVPPDLESLSYDFRQLLEREMFPDVKLRCEDRNISAHRSILAARSDVFTAMFRNKMAESETGTVDITDVDPEVLDLLLKYVYSGKILDISDDTASSLYEAGDKYAIHDLKKACSDWMVKNLRAQNCLGYLVVADAHSDEEFKERVVDFIAENLKSIKKDAWSKFKKDHPLLANNVYEKRLAPTLAEQA